MNQQIDNALGGYEESDTLLDTIKELRPYGKFEDIAPAMADRIIADAEKIARLREALREVWPRYKELFVLSGLGEPKDSVIAEQVEQALKESE